MPSKTTLPDNPGIVLVITYLLLFAVNSLVLYLGHLWFPQYIVLGAASVNPTWAILHSMGILALLNTFAIPFIREIETQRHKLFSNTDWMVTYFALNFVGIWLITRLAQQLGFGITSWVVAAALAFVLDLIQGAAMMQLEKLRRS